ncbi:acyl-CoA dehydrogenase family protein [Rhabdothermincola sp.]|uniref:acyl-CoA dehydrogenase family protein n=1 Tax=Rhabdothermincola sp. TaxID=2820405 RepID=UPI002FDF8DFC
MHLAYTPEQEALRQELRAYFARIVTPEVEEEMARGEMGGPHCLEAVRQMGRDNWLAVSWPEEYGGRNLSLVEQFIFFEEAHGANAPVPFLTVNTVGQTILQYGTEEQKRWLLPGILRGETHFAIGYTEPNSGTDLASLQTRAVRDGDEWVINGQKIFTSLAGFANYIWLAARTDPDAPKHKGITIFVVPTDTPGFSWQPIETLGGADTTYTFYEDVRVPDANIVGGLNNGWSLITNQLNYERVSLAIPAWAGRIFEKVVAWAKEHQTPDGERVIDQEWVQISLARCRAKIDYLTLLNWKAATSDQLDPALASATKVYGTEMYIEVYRALMEILGQAGYLRRHSPGAVLAAHLERAYQGTLILTFGGGTNEIQRDLIALFGLGMPRTPRM